ncbi:MAG: MogA/MoaB family molybdenum cofactor biosynthesis protein [Mycobacteriaceae bacterium]
MRTASVVVASTRAAAGLYEDKTGPIIVQWLASLGFSVGGPVIVADGDGVGEAIRAAVLAGSHLILTTGGTGISPTDDTPAQTEKLLDYQIPGLADAIRLAGLPGVPTAVLSRGVAGVAKRSLIINFPGSLGGVRDGIKTLEPILDHALNQLRGEGH